MVLYWSGTVIPVLGMLRQEDCYTFKNSLAYRVRLSQKTITASILNWERQRTCVWYRFWIRRRSLNKKRKSVPTSIWRWHRKSKKKVFRVKEKSVRLESIPSTLKNLLDRLNLPQVKQHFHIQAKTKATVNTYAHRDQKWRGSEGRFLLRWSHLILKEELLEQASW